MARRFQIVNAMSEISSPIRAVPYFPDDLTLPQFLFDHQHPIRLPREPEIPWIVDSVSGKTYLQEEVRTLLGISLRLHSSNLKLYERTWCLANALSLSYALGKYKLL
jgi:hypothetical protein